MTIDLIIRKALLLLLSAAVTVLAVPVNAAEKSDSAKQNNQYHYQLKKISVLTEKHDLTPQIPDAHDFDQLASELHKDALNKLSIEDVSYSRDHMLQAF